MSEYITDAEIDEMVRRLEAHVAVDIRTALRDAVLWGARYAEVRQQSKSGGLRCTRCNAAFVQAGEAWVHPFSESGCPAACVGVVLSQSHKPGGENG